MMKIQFHSPKIDSRIGATASQEETLEWSAAEDIVLSFSAAIDEFGVDEAGDCASSAWGMK